MKKLLILTALAMLTATTTGCKCGLFNRGPACNTTYAPAGPACAPPADPYINSPPVNTAPPVYAPAPG